jgi:S-adenosylmethionine hydrolase
MGHSPTARIITLLTDFGPKDPYVGIMKGVILTVNPGVTIVDITHDISPQNIEEAAFLIEEYHRFFPAGTIHLAVVDPTVGSSRKPIIVYKESGVFVGPDNGLFTLILDNAEIHVIENPAFMLGAISSTFHGRDIFALRRDIFQQGFISQLSGNPYPTLCALIPCFPTEKPIH